MTDANVDEVAAPGPGPVPAQAELIEDGTDPGGGSREPGETIESPAKVLRIGTMTKELLEEVRRAPLDEAGRSRLREIYETSVAELGSCLPGELGDELARLTSPFESASPSEAELRVAQAQLVGWLEGLFHGIQATLVSQQMAARAQLEEMRNRGLPPGPSPDAPRPGTYL
ncbi:MAG: proteasome activator [Acidimicrobiales bacterium]